MGDVVNAIAELSAREERAVRAALREASAAGVVRTNEGTAPPVVLICRALRHAAREIPRREMPARLGISRPELDALFGRVVALWALEATGQ